MPYKHEAVDSGRLDGSKGNFNRVSHEETDLIGGFDFKIIAIGGLAFGVILIKLRLVLEILKVMSINLDIKLTHNNINLKRNISISIILPSKNFSSNT